MRLSLDEVSDWIVSYLLIGAISIVNAISSKDLCTLYYETFGWHSAYINKIE